MVDDGGGAPLSQKEKIDILLEEYRTLRAENIQSASRYNYIYAGGAAAEAWAFSASGATGASLWLLAGGIAIVAFSLVSLVGRSVWTISQRLRELEGEINARSRSILLVWEQLYGGARRSSLIGSLFPMEPWPRSKVDERANTLPPDGHW
jgi:hypothetical protein